MTQNIDKRETNQTIKKDIDDVEKAGKNVNTSGKISDRLETEAPMFTEPATSREHKLLGQTPAF